MKKTPDAAGYEARDARSRPVIWFLTGVAVLTLGCGVGLVLFYRWMASTSVSTDPPAFNVRDQRWNPPDVTLENHPSHLREIYEQEQEELKTSYGWIDAKKGLVRIPVEEAMRQLLEKGLPVRKKAEDA